MRRAIWSIGVASVITGLSGGSALAQGAAQAELVVPTFGIFTAGTTISVPDRGYSGIGGMRGSTDSRVEFGPGFERGFASRRVASDAGARVWIHDFQEMEQGLAHRASRPVRPAEGFAARVFDYTSTPIDSKDPKSGGESNGDRLADQPKDPLSASFKIAHAADLLKRGREAEERGKLKVAALYYKSVLSLGATPNAMDAKQRLAALQSKLAAR